MSHRILLVDDEVDILEFVRYNLVREGYEVFTAENGAEALKVAAGADVIVAALGESSEMSGPAARSAETPC